MKDFYRALQGTFHDIFRENIKEGLQEVAQYRRELGGHKVNLTVSVIMPICLDCAYDWRYYYFGLEYSDVPQISLENWSLDLLLLGVPLSDISDMEDEIAEEIEETRGPFCCQCKRPLPYWEDEESACHSVEVPLSEYISHQSEEKSTSVSKSLKKVILEAYGENCFGCDKSLKGTEVTIDHIIPKSKGGKADIFNLQPLCESCNQEKADQVPLEKNIVLHFPLRPMPSDSYEGLFW